MVHHYKLDNEFATLTKNNSANRTHCLHCFITQFTISELTVHKCIQKSIKRIPNFSTHLVCNLEVCLQKKCDVGFELAANKSEDSCCSPCGKSQISVVLNLKHNYSDFAVIHK